MIARWTPEQLRDAGNRIYGHTRWSNQLARDLGVNDRTVGRWLSGDLLVPHYVQIWAQRRLPQGEDSEEMLRMYDIPLEPGDWDMVERIEGDFGRMIVDYCTPSGYPAVIDCTQECDSAGRCLHARVSVDAETLTGICHDCEARWQLVSLATDIDTWTLNLARSENQPVLG